MRRHFTSALSVVWALCLAWPVSAATPPDPETYGARPEAGDIARAREWLDAGVPVDSVADRIGTGLMIGAWTGNLELMIGTGVKGDGPDGDPLKCQLARPHGIFVDQDGSVFVGDSENHRVRVWKK